MTIDRLCSYYGFTKMPFGRDLAPGALFRSAAHAEAVARLTWCVAERGLATLCGEVGSGKTVALRATVAALEPSRHQVIYCPNPIVGGRGILSLIVSALGAKPRFHRAGLVPQAAEALATAGDRTGTPGARGHRRKPPIRRRAARGSAHADQRRARFPFSRLGDPDRPAHPAASPVPRHDGRVGPAHHPAGAHRRDGPGRDARLCPPSSEPGGPI